jgi:hypothetical protein
MFIAVVVVAVDIFVLVKLLHGWVQLLVTTSIGQAVIIIVTTTPHQPLKGVADGKGHSSATRGHGQVLDRRVPHVAPCSPCLDSADQEQTGQRKDAGRAKSHVDIGDKGIGDDGR